MLFLNIDIKLSSKNQKQLKRFLIILKSFKSKCKLNLKVYLFSNIISKQIRSKRSKMLRSLSVKMRRNFYLKQLGTKKSILFESENKKGFIHGFSENYVRVKTPWRKSLVDKIVNYDLKKISDDGFVILEDSKNLVKV